MALPLCETHCSRAALCKEKDCQALHICKFFIVGGNCGLPAYGCRFGHDVHTPHNQKLLQKLSLQEKSLKNLQDICRQNRQEGVTVPAICKHYNIASGCRIKPDLQCHFLHVCQHYMKETCKFGHKCKRSHNIFDSQPKSLLEMYAINVERSINEVLAELRHLQNVEKSYSVNDENNDIEICSYFLRGRCNFSENCRNLHRYVPYQWQIWSDRKWEDVDDESNKALDACYCDQQIVQCLVKMEGCPLQQIDFKCMEMNLNEETDKFCLPWRRISTPSSVESVPRGLLAETTVWKWYWKDDDNKYIEYGVVFSDTLEKAFLEDRIGTFLFSIGGNSYELDFKTMTQRNTDELYNTKREVRRRPEPHANKKAERYLYGSGNVPANWTRMDDESGEYRAIELNPCGEEFRMVEQLFRDTMPNEIQNIKRIQNLELWEKYASKKKWMLKSLPSVSETQLELNLFHGTDYCYIDDICRRGFDWRISRRLACGQGSAYGHGSYFHREAGYCSIFGFDCKQMFLARVLVGRYATGSRGYSRPPPIDPNKPMGKLFDSCVSNVFDPYTFIIFSHEQTYPEYLISYK